MHRRDGAASGTRSSASRRDFLRAASAAAIGAMMLDPEKLLWVPGSRSFFEIHRPVRILHGEGWHQVLKGELITTSDYSKRWVRVLEDGGVHVALQRHIFFNPTILLRCPCAV